MLAMARVFVSYAREDASKAKAIASALEQASFDVWFDQRLHSGSEFSREIEHALKEAAAVIVLWSRSSLESAWVRDEAAEGRDSGRLIPVLLDDVRPPIGFRQFQATDLSRWSGRGKPKNLDDVISAVAARIDAPRQAANGRRATSHLAGSRRPALLAVAAVAVVLAAGSAWRLTRPVRAPQHSLQVRLVSFQRLSSDLPETMPDAMRAEITAAFGDDGVITVSSAAQAPKDAAPAYALGGTMGRDGGKLEVIARLTNERTGTTMWSKSYEYEIAQASKAPRRVAINASTIIRCGLFGASTYPKQLPEPVLGDYFEACQNGDEPGKALDFARKVVAAVPDFSWGWSAVEIADFNAMLQRPPDEQFSELRQEGLRAANNAIRLDKSNSEAYAYKSQLIDHSDLVGREKLLEQAVHARTLPCGCEHHLYGDFLSEVGRIDDAIAEYRRSTDIMPLDPNSQLSLAQALLMTGRPDLAQTHLDAALELDDDPRAPNIVKTSLAPITGDFAGAIEAVNDPKLGAPPPIRPGLSSAFSALLSKDTGAKRDALAKLEAAPSGLRGEVWVALLAMLGANRQALDATVTAALDPRRFGSRSWLFTPPLAGALHDPAFPEAAEHLNLMKYWRTTDTKPDVCRQPNAPAFCRMI
jgi:tetratricopeptide (TPR) repeat protein